MMSKLLEVLNNENVAYLKYLTPTKNSLEINKSYRV